MWCGWELIWRLARKKAIKDFDIGGLIVTINRLLTDTKFIRKVKEEFIFGSFEKLIQGDELSSRTV